MVELKTIITLRQGTTAQWADSEVVLKTGEMGLEYLLDGNVKIKAGDGEHLWGDLPYIGSDVKAVDDVIAKASANEAAIKTINETTIPAISTEIAKKVDKTTLDDYYTKNEVVAITGTVTEGKTLVQMISDAKNEATYDDTDIKQLITNEANTARAAEKANANEIARVNDVLVAALDNNAEGLDSIKELADWINKHGVEASAMADVIKNNTEAIAAINHVDTGILAQAKAHTNAAIAALPVATAETLGLVKYDNDSIKMNESNQLYVAKVSTDVLEQGSMTLVLNGGSAIN